MMDSPSSTSEAAEVFIQAPGSGRQSQFLAWIVLLLSFAVFVLAVIFLPGRIAAVVGRLTVDTPLQAEPIEGTVLLKGPFDTAWKQLREPAEAGPGTRFSTDGRSRAFLELFEGSTVQLYNNTELVLNESQRGRFDEANQKVVLTLNRGRLAVGVAHSANEESRHLGIATPTGRMLLLEGSYVIETFADERVEVLVRRGKATFISGDEIAEVGVGGRGGYGPNMTPRGDLPTLSPLVLDSRLARPLNLSPWRAFIETESGPSGRVIEIAVEATPGDIPGLDHDFGYRFRRMSSAEEINRHGEAGVTQIINRDIRDLAELHILARVRVDYQGLSGGGSLGTEYPIMIKLFYIDSHGQDQIWYQGFYAQNDDGFSISGGTEVPAGEWVSYDNPNLLQVLNPTPVFIRRIEALGSGWDFDSTVTEVVLEGR